MISISTKQTGFTLVELLVVMLILVAMASVTIETTSELAFQNRYEVTKDRYAKIKRAIIGRPDVLINGQPDISGFVADVGRLPNNLHELLEEQFCSQRWKLVSGDKVYYETPAACNADGRIWSAPISDWKGPYLSITKNPLHDNAFPDGWGNQDSTLNAYCSDPTYATQVTCEDAAETWHEGAAGQNYGWKVEFWDTANAITTTQTNYAHMIIQSKGKNGTIAVADTDYDADYPLAGALPSIRYDDWTVNITNGLMIRIQPPITFTPCDITTLANQNSCEVAGQYWFPSQRCEDSSKTTLVSCTPSPFVWDSNNSTCIDSSKDFAACSTTPFSWETRTAGCEVFNATSCNGAGFVWNTTTTICESKNKAFCDNYVSTPTPVSPISLSLELYHEANTSTFTATSGSAAIIENEQPQNLLFTGIAPSDIPQGMYKLKIKNGVADYPPGHLPIFIYFVPNRTISTINW